LRLDTSGKFLSVGLPCKGVSVRIVDEAGPVGPGLEGEICVKSPGVMQGYYKNAEATRRVLSPDGWLRTGDLGFLDREGYLFITGRLKDLIILGGANLVPADIEEIVDHVPGVRYSAAVGVESERTGSQRLHVVAEVREGAEDTEALSGLVREIVQRVHRGVGHRPARVLLVKPSTIPKTSSGKIQRSRLVQMIAHEELGERIVYASGGHGS
jgi:fatty-acyl-CoA synthase